jgi:hypothetical protein
VKGRHADSDPDRGNEELPIAGTEGRPRGHPYKDQVLSYVAR